MPSSHYTLSSPIVFYKKINRKKCKSQLSTYAISLLPIQYRFIHKKTSPISKKAKKAAKPTPLYEKFYSPLAGAAGLEPATCGFGDRRSTN